MAPTIDPTKGDGALRSLWDAGRDLTTTAATCNELQRSLEAAQDEYTVAAAKRDELYEVLGRARREYAAAHARAVAAGWSSAELLDSGLPRPESARRGPRSTADAGPLAQTRRSGRAARQHQSPATRPQA